MTQITKDTLQDLIDHTLSLGVIDLIKVTGTQDDTVINAASDDRTLIMNGKYKNPVAGFIGVFGMPNLTKLKTILGFTDEYDENAKITMMTKTMDTETFPSSIHFENKIGDFVNDYRLMSKTLIEEKVRQVMFKGATWNVSFQPTIAGVQRLKKQANVHNEENVFTTTMDNGNLVVSFGDPATHSGNFVFHHALTGSFTRPIMWPVKHFVSVMDLVGDKHIYISDQGVMRITVDSGVAMYEYLIPSQSK